MSSRIAPQQDLEKALNDIVKKLLFWHENKILEKLKNLKRENPADSEKANEAEGWLFTDDAPGFIEFVKKINPSFTHLSRAETALAQEINSSYTLICQTWSNLNLGPLAADDYLPILIKLISKPIQQLTPKQQAGITKILEEISLPETLQKGEMAYTLTSFNAACYIAKNVVDGAHKEDEKVERFFKLQEKIKLRSAAKEKKQKTSVEAKIEPELKFDLVKEREKLQKLSNLHNMYFNMEIYQKYNAMLNALENDDSQTAILACIQFGKFLEKRFPDKNISAIKAELSKINFGIKISAKAQSLLNILQKNDFPIESDNDFSLRLAMKLGRISFGVLSSPLPATELKAEDSSPDIASREREVARFIKEDLMPNTALLKQLDDNINSMTKKYDDLWRSLIIDGKKGTPRHQAEFQGEQNKTQLKGELEQLTNRFFIEPTQNSLDAITLAYEKALLKMYQHYLNNKIQKINVEKNLTDQNKNEDYAKKHPDFSLLLNKKKQVALLTDTLEKKNIPGATLKLKEYKEKLVKNANLFNQQASKKETSWLKFALFSFLSGVLYTIGYGISNLCLNKEDAKSKEFLKIAGIHQNKITSSTAQIPFQSTPIPEATAPLSKSNVSTPKQITIQPSPVVNVEPTQSSKRKIS